MEREGALHMKTAKCWFVVVAMVVGATACSSSKPADTGGACTPDPTLIAERRACRADDQCPCGAHCTLGECVADCGAKTACGAGQTCDTFGRCRAANDTSKVAPLAAADQGSVRVENSVVSLGGGTANLQFAARDRDLGPVRVTVSEDFELDCDGSGNWKAECTDPSLAAGKKRSLPVRVKAGAPTMKLGEATGTIGIARVFSGSRVETVTLSTVGLLLDPPAGFSGTFSGKAVLLDLSIAPKPADPPGLDGTTPALSAPVSAQAFESPDGNGGMIVVTDPLHVLSSSGTMIGAIQPKDDVGGTVAFPATVDQSGVLAAGLTTEVLATAPTASYSVTPGAQSISVTIPIAYEGVIQGSRKPLAVWQLTLARQGDLPKDAVAPKVPAAQTPTLNAMAANQPSSWQAALTAGFEPWSAARSPADQQQLLATWQPTNGDSAQVRRLDACTADGRRLAATLLAKDEWRASTVSAASPISLTDIQPAAKTLKNSLIGLALRPVTATYVDTVSVSQVTMTTTSEEAIPCAITFPTADVNCIDGVDGVTSTPFGMLDRCAEIAKEVGCYPTNGTGTLAFQLALKTTKVVSPSTCTSTPTIMTGTITKVCALQPVSANCGQMVSCLEGNGVSSSSPSTDPLDVLEVGGDLSCGAGTRTLATVADFNRNQLTNTDSTSKVVKNALRDFGALSGAASASLPAGSAFDTVRALIALEYATEVDRQRATDPTHPSSDVASRFAHRLFQQWFTMSGLIAHEAAQHWQVPDSIRGLSVDPAFPTVTNALTASLDGWKLLLHPRFANALAGMSGAVLASPDYRPDWITTVPPDPNAQQSDGLPVTMLETLKAQLELTNLALQKASLAQDKKALDLAGRAIRTGLIIESMVNDLYARTLVAAGKAPPWDAKFKLASASFSGALRRTIRQANLLQNNANPLGIEDSDLPLYFYGASTDAVDRFSTISDYLLGGTTSTGWAMSLVAQAQAAAKDVTDAYQNQVDRQYQTALSVNDAQNRVDDIRRDWGGRILNLCGLPDGMSTLDALERWTDFNASSCYYAKDRPACRLEMRPVDAELDHDTVLYNFCVARFINSAIYPPGSAAEKSARDHDLPVRTVRYADPLLNRLLLDVFYSRVLSCEYGIDQCDPDMNPKLGCLKCGDHATGNVTVAQLSSLDLSAITTDQLLYAQNACRQTYANAKQSLPKPDDTAKSVLSNSACYRGSLGDLAQTIQGAIKDVEIARSQYGDHLDAYDIAMTGCSIKIQSNSKLDELRNSHNANMKKLRSDKAVADSVASAAGAVKDCAALVSSASVGSLSGATGVGCVGAFVEAGAQIAGIQMQAAMDDAEAAYQSQVELVNEFTDVKLCLNEAHQQLVGMRTAQQQIERAMLDLIHAQNQLQTAVSEAQATFDEGRAALATAKVRTLRPPMVDYWADQKVSHFISLMSQARRASYLAERAVEYEFQASMSARGQILAAETPDQLNDVLLNLNNTAGTLGINGHRPANLKVVVSLRDHLLQLFNTSKVKPAEQKLTEAERFRLLLNDSRFALQNGGKYVGQLIPFSVVPLGALNGDTKGIPIFATTDCAERIWSVNASILGTGRLYQGSATTFARIDVLKANTFFSQWCTAPQGGGAFQTASVRPSHNLFRDPTFGSSGPAVGGTSDMTTGASTSSPNVGDETQNYTRARLQAYLNVAQDALEDDQYANGASAELATRGLYGDYALFFPKEILSVVKKDAKGKIVSATDGLDLGAVDDILLRIDYVSVAR